MEHQPPVRESTPEATQPTLPFTERNPHGTSTILFIHGSGTVGVCWDPIVAHLPTYHALLPDLPCHGAAASTLPTFSIKQTVALLAALIRKHAHNGRAHIVAHSLGAHVAAHLLSTHPDLTAPLPAFLSGYCVLPGYSPGAVATAFRLESLVPQSLVNWIGGLKDMPRTGSMPRTWHRTVAEIITTEDWPAPWPARTLVFAAGKGGIVPTADPPECAVQLRDVGRKGNPETVAYTHSQMRHAWPIHEPLLFARALQAWFEEKPLPDGFRLL